MDFSAATTRQLALATDLCRASGARLIVHHNVRDLSIGSGVGWMWHAGQAGQPEPQSEGSPEDLLRQLVAQVPEGLRVEPCLTRGGVQESVLAVSQAAEADLIILSTHAGKTEDHASVIEFLLAHSRSSVLALHDPGALSDEKSILWGNV